MFNRPQIRSFACVLALQATLSFATVFDSSAANMLVQNPATTANSSRNIILAANVNGANVKKVEYENGGSFKQKKDGNWVEKNGNGKFNFKETGRDEWSVYLLDESRGVNIQLDLHRKEIFYSDATTEKRVQYKISSFK